MANHSRMMKGKIDIKDLERNLGNFTLIAIIEEKHQETLEDGKIANYAIIIDETGRIKFNLQDFQIDKVFVGRTVKISGAFTEVRDGSLEIYSYKDIVPC